MKKKETKCKKCKQFHYCDQHHILPKGLFGKGEVVELCKNCHDQYHRYLGHEYLREENRQEMEFYFLKWYQWLYGLSITAIMLGLWWALR